MNCFPDDKILELFTTRIHIEKLFAGVISKHIEGNTNHHSFILNISQEKVISIQIRSDSFEIKAVINTVKWKSAIHSGWNRLPRGNGIFYYNGTPIAQYRNGDVVFDSEELPPIHTIKDSFSRRYLWARALKQSLPAALAYATRRRYILKSSGFALASFCGDTGKAPFLTSEDLNIVAQLDIRQQIAILLMCYMWNSCAPGCDAFTDTDDSQGGKICSIPSFGTSVIQAKPAVHPADYLVCFIAEGGWLVFVLLFLCYAVALEMFSLAETGSGRSVFYTCTFFILIGITVAGILLKKPFKSFKVEDILP